MRADKFLVEKGLFESRNRASEAIRGGRVTIDGALAKPSTRCSDSSKIEIMEDRFYVSRSAEKLELFLQDSNLDLEGLSALDIGSSTGGFVQIVLERGVREVVAVDVGDNQLHRSLRGDERVKLFENRDIREFQYGGRFDIVTCDVSFISILKILDSIDRLSRRHIVILFKPQFEVGRGVKRSRRGVVLDRDAISRARERFENSANNLGWILQRVSQSKVAGKSGNLEYLYHYIKRFSDET
ncbi:MAG: TlyA family RNA methyltransferase [Epsilonproteobacteria bacterium]|nr:TlyA family RNA methyltransferase [Campylobacterota bacterium]